MPRHLLRVRAVAESPDLGDRRGQGDVADRPDVRPAEDHQQVDRRRPSADPRHRLEAASARRASSSVSEAVEVERARLDRRRQRPAVARLLAAEPDREQLRVREGRGIGRASAGRAACRSRSKAACADASETCCSRMMWSSVANPGAGPTAAADRSARRSRRGPGRAPPSSVTAAARRASVSGRPASVDPRRATRRPRRVAEPGCRQRIERAALAPRNQARAFSPSDGRW